MAAIVELGSNPGFAVVIYALKAAAFNIEPDIFEGADSVDGCIKKEFLTGQYNGFTGAQRKYLELLALLQREVKEHEDKQK